MPESFDKCCNEPNKVRYSIQHDPKPISVSRDLEETLKLLLWYAPNINSKQSEQNDLIYEELYSDFVFGCFMEYMGLSDKDVLWLDYNDDSTQYKNFFSGQICLSCQKIVLKKFRSESKMRCLLRHLRNSLAHGFFNINGTMFIGFDEYREDGTGTMKTDGIIKVNLPLLKESLRRTTADMTRERLIKKALQKCGYSIIDTSLADMHNARLQYDVAAQKNKKTYLIEVKEYPGKRYIKDDYVDRIRNQFRKLPRMQNNTFKVLFIDTAFLSQRSRQLLSQDKIYIIDKRMVKDMFAGIDALQRLVK